MQSLDKIGQISFAKTDKLSRLPVSRVVGEAMLFLILYFLCFTQSNAFRFGFLIDDYSGQFDGCSVAQFGMISDTASEDDRHHLSETLNHLFRVNWKAKFSKVAMDQGFACTLKSLNKPKTWSSFHELAIEGEMNSFLALIKTQLGTQMPTPQFFDAITFFKTPVMVCPAAVADGLLRQSEVTIKLAKAAIERPHQSADPIDISLIDSEFDSKFEVASYKSTGTLDDFLLSTREERLASLKKKQRRCTSSCCTIM